MIKVFYCYAREDERLRRRLADVYLKPLRRSGLITEWHDRMIVPGQAWEQEIDANLEDSDLFLLLVSADFVASNYCVEKEITRALERQNLGEAVVIPIILREIMMGSLPRALANLQQLPTDGKAVTNWGSLDRAFNNVAEGVEAAIKRFLVLDGYSDPVEQAMRDCCLVLDKVAVKNLLGKPLPREDQCFEEWVSDRGTRGYRWGFTRGGAIHWGARNGAYPVWGYIGGLYHSREDVRRYLGYPVSGEIESEAPRWGAVGCCQRFEGRWDYHTVDGITFGATVYWMSGQNHAYPTWGGIGEHYEKLDGKFGVLGFPVSEEIWVKSSFGTECCYQEFQGGVVYWCERFGSIHVVDPIFKIYQYCEGPGGRFGLPIADAAPFEDHPGGFVQEFEGGVISANAETSSAGDYR